MRLRKKRKINLETVTKMEFGFALLQELVSIIKKIYYTHKFL